MSRILVAFFSATGTTRKIAQKLAEKIGADIFEIIPNTPYSDEDLNWQVDNSRSALEMQDEASRPEFKNKPESLSNYDLVLVGFPIWWGQAPRIINSFLENTDWSGKRLISFGTSGSSGISGSTQLLKASAFGADFTQGKIINDGNLDDFIAEFISENEPAPGSKFASEENISHESEPTPENR